MNYKEKYERALAKAIEFEAKGIHGFEEIFPELKESKDEEIRNYLIDFVKINDGVNLPPDYAKKALAWLEEQKDYEDKLEKAYKTADEVQYRRGYEAAKREFEKQGEKKPTESRQETKPNGGIVYEDFNEGDGFYKVNLAHLSKSQVRLIENLVASWQNLTNNTAEWSEEDERICQCLIKDQDKALNEVKNDKYGHSEIISDLKEMYRERIGWLKSLKRRMKGETK